MRTVLRARVDLALTPPMMFTDARNSRRTFQTWSLCKVGIGSGGSWKGPPFRSSHVNQLMRIEIEVRSRIDSDVELEEESRQ